MNIYAKSGTKVKFTGKGGYDHENEYAKQHLTTGQIYTIDHTEVDNCHTDVFLKEKPGKSFNSVLFEDINT